MFYLRNVFFSGTATGSDSDSGVGSSAGSDSGVGCLFDFGSSSWIFDLLQIFSAPIDLRYY